MSGVIDPFLLGSIKIGLAVVGVCGFLALFVWWCSHIRDRTIGTTLAAVGAWLAATWFAGFVRKHTRPRGA